MALKMVYSATTEWGLEITASEIYTSLKRALEKNDKESVYHFYQQVAEQSPLSYIDDLIHLIVDKQEIHVPKLEAFTDWLLTIAPILMWLNWPFPLLCFFQVMNALRHFIVLLAMMNSRFTLLSQSMRCSHPHLTMMQCG